MAGFNNFNFSSMFQRDKLDEAEKLRQQQIQQNQPPNTPPAKEDEEVKDPLEAFKKMFDPPEPTEDERKKAEEDAAKKRVPSIAEILQREDFDKNVRSKLDFRKMVKDETLAKLKSEDAEEGNAALFEIMNDIAKGTWEQSLLHTGTLIEDTMGQRLNQAVETMQTGMESRIKNFMLEQSIEKEKVSENPVIKAGQMLIAKGLQDAHPDASPEWIQEQVGIFFTESGKAFNPSNESRDDLEATQGTDWDAFIAQDEGAEAPPNLNQQQGET